MVRMTFPHRDANTGRITPPRVRFPPITIIRPMSVFDPYYLEHRGLLLACLMISPALAILFNAILFRDFSLELPQNKT